MKYIDADQIRAEIERRLKRENEILWNAKKRGTYPSPSCEYNLLTLTSLLAFLDTLPEQPDGLEEAAEEYNKQVIEETKCHHNALTYAEGYEDALLLIPDAFIAGAEWQKTKIIKDAVEGVVMDFSSNLPRPQVDIRLDPGKYHTGDKVKVIVIKEDEK